jgi:DedD protein
VSAARGRRGGSRVGTLLVLSGCIGILGVTFLLGVWAGRQSVPRAPAPAVDTPPAGARAGARPATPALTFYQELTAPLAAPPPAPRPGARPRPDRPAARAVEAPGERAGEPHGAPAAPEASAVPPAERAAVPGERYTVQVAAYKTKEPADVLRRTLAAAGHDAYVAETESPLGIRYRVRVGTFTSREAAQEAAARLGRGQALPAFVTTR